MYKVTPFEIALVESALFSSRDALSSQDVARITKIKKDKIEVILKTLKIKYENPEHGIQLSEAGGWLLVVKPEYQEKVAELTRPELSKGLLRVLSMIAYHEPVKQSDIVKIIGNRTYEYVQELEKRGFVVSEKKAKTKILKTTHQFEVYFATKKEDLKKALEKKVEETKPDDQSSA